MIKVYKNLPLALLEIQHDFLFTQNGLISEKEHLSRQQLRAELKPVIKYLQHRADYPDVPYTLPIMDYAEPTYAIEILNEHRARKQMELKSLISRHEAHIGADYIVSKNPADLQAPLTEFDQALCEGLNKNIDELDAVINLLSIEGAGDE